MRQPRAAGITVAVPALLAGLLVLAACGGSAHGKSVEVSTANGQVSVSLNGKLPPNWPSDVPIPPGANPAGSASLVGKANGIMAGVYRSSQSPEEVYNFYASDSSITTTSKVGVGSGSNYVGRVSMSAPVTADVTIVPYQGGSLIVVAIHGGQGPSTTSTTLSSGTTG